MQEKTPLYGGVFASGPSFPLPENAEILVPAFY
jgi:hypothetical protein